MAQRRADAAVLMAETSLQSAGRDIAAADRFQVLVTADVEDLLNNNMEVREFDESSDEENMCDREESVISSTEKHIPSKHATIVGASFGVNSIEKETLRRIACDCSLSALVNQNGEPVDIGRKTRVWPVAMARAIKARDKQCVFPGCCQSRHLQIHHIVHWADGGTTSVSNGACLCSHHHTLVHEGGYRIERVDSNETLMHEQFVNQTATETDSTCIEQLLRGSPESFDALRHLSPERFRFRVVDSAGHDVTSSKINTKFSVHFDSDVDLPASRGSTDTESAEKFENREHQFGVHLCNAAINSDSIPVKSVRGESTIKSCRVFQKSG